MLVRAEPATGRTPRVLTTMWPPGQSGGWIWSGLSPRSQTSSVCTARRIAEGWKSETQPSASLPEHSGGQRNSDRMALVSDGLGCCRICDRFGTYLGIRVGQGEHDRVLRYPGHVSRGDEIRCRHPDERVCACQNTADRNALAVGIAEPGEPFLDRVRAGDPCELRPYDPRPRSCPHLPHA